MQRRILGLTLAAAAAAWLGVAGAVFADEALGYVSSVSGEATAQLGSEEPRALHCGDPVYAGDLLRTAKSSSVGVLSGDVMTELAADSQLRLDRTGSLPAATLERGKVRMLDPRESGAPARLAARDARAEVMGNDAEAYVFEEKVGPYAMLCEWDSGLPVSRGPEERKLAKPGECVIAKPAEPLYTARAHEARIPVVADDVCAIDPGLLASLAGAPPSHLSPADVAAPPPVAGVGTAGLGALAPQNPQPPARTPCDTPGAGCGTPFPAIAMPGGPVVAPPPGLGGVAPAP